MIKSTVIDICSQQIGSFLSVFVNQITLLHNDSRCKTTLLLGYTSGYFIFHVDKNWQKRISLWHVLCIDKGYMLMAFYSLYHWKSKSQGFQFQFRCVKSLEVVTPILATRKIWTNWVLMTFLGPIGEMSFTGTSTSLRSEELQENPENYNQDLLPCSSGC